MVKVCLDTCVLIWGIQRNSTPNRQNMIARAAALIEELGRSKAKVGIPAPALWEFLVGVPEDRREAAAEYLCRGKGFRVLPFDYRAALAAAKLWDQYRPLVPTGNPDDPGRRDRFKVDCQIIATACLAGLDIIYTEDGDMDVFAGCGIEIRRLPPVDLQESLFKVPKLSEVGN